MEIGGRIREIALRKDCSVIELGKRIGKSRQSIYDIYTGKVSVSVEMLQKIAAALDEPIEHFLEEQAKPAIDKENLKNVIGEILQRVLRRHYLHFSLLQDLSKEIHEKALKGEGMVNLRVVRDDDGVNLSGLYRSLKEPISRKELEKFKKIMFNDWFANKGPLFDRFQIREAINAYFDEKSEENEEKIS
jgi:transcriptional regulator with XRE-family HTH domain